MKCSAQTFFPAIFAAACALAVVVGPRAGTAQITGCCIGPVCANKTAQSCSASGGTALSSTCTSSDDPRCTACSRLTGTARGLCNAYCNALDCPEGHRGRACERLRANWQKQTGLPLFPCDAVCCQCATGPLCTTARRCRDAQCTIIDRCEDGKCPEFECCECPNDGCTATTPKNCQRHGCVPKDDAVCTPTGRCEECPCGADCVTDAGKGRCVPISGTNDCECQVPPPCGFDAAGVCGGECPDAETCTLLADGSCRCAQPPLPCDQRATCGGDCTEGGVTGICQLENGTTVPVCKCVPPSIGCGDPADQTCSGVCSVAGDRCVLQPSSGLCECVGG